MVRVAIFFSKRALSVFEKIPCNSFGCGIVFAAAFAGIGLLAYHAYNFWKDDLYMSWGMIEQCELAIMYVANDLC